MAKDFKARFFFTDSDERTVSSFTGNSNPTPGNGGFIGRVALGSSTYGPTATHKEALDTATKLLNQIKGKLKDVSQKTIPELEQKLKASGAPWIEGQGLIDN